MNILEDYENYLVNKTVKLEKQFKQKENKTMTAKEWIDMLEKEANESTNNNNNVWYSYEETTIPTTEKVIGGKIFSEEEIHFYNRIFNKTFFNENDLVPWLKEVKINPSMNHDQIYAILYGKIKCYFHEVIVRLGTPNQKKKPSVGIGIESMDFIMNPKRDGFINFICESEDHFLVEPCQKLEEVMRMAQSFGWQFNFEGNVKTGESQVYPVESSVHITY